MLPNDELTYFISAEIKWEKIPNMTPPTPAGQEWGAASRLSDPSVTLLPAAAAYGGDGGAWQSAQGLSGVWESDNPGKWGVDAPQSTVPAHPGPAPGAPAKGQPASPLASRRGGHQNIPLR